MPPGSLHLGAESPIVAHLAELALFAVLFTDGMRVGWADLRSAWRLPGRALGWGLPLTLLVTAVLAHYVAGLDWPEALLIGAILAPTDPVFAAALVGNDKVPGPAAAPAQRRVRRQRRPGPAVRGGAPRGRGRLGRPAPGELGRRTGRRVC